MGCQFAPTTPGEFVVSVEKPLSRRPAECPDMKPAGRGELITPADLADRSNACRKGTVLCPSGNPPVVALRRIGPAAHATDLSWRLDRLSILANVFDLRSSLQALPMSTSAALPELTGHDDVPIGDVARLSDL